MTTTDPTTAAEDMVRLTASIYEHPTIEQIDELLALISSQPADVARAWIVDGLLDMKAIILEVESSLA